MKPTTRYIQAFILGTTMLAGSLAYGQSATSDEIVDISLSFKETIDIEKGISKDLIHGTLTATPKDTNYEIEGLDVYLRTGDKLRAQAKGNSGSVSIAKIAGAVPKKGDFLVVKVTAMSRTDSKGVKERISTKGMIYTIEVK